MKHTPGKWISRCDALDCGFVVTSSGSPFVCEKWFDKCTESDLDEAFANARLIAAAPDMLDGHIDILRIIKGVKIGSLTHETAIGMIKIISEARIERATGEHPEVNHE